MINRLSLKEDENNEKSASAFYWWRLANDFADIKLHPLNVFNLKPIVRVLREMEMLAMVASEGLDEFAMSFSATVQGICGSPPEELRRKIWRYYLLVSVDDKNKRSQIYG